MPKTWILRALGRGFSKGHEERGKVTFETNRLCRTGMESDASVSRSFMVSTRSKVMWLLKIG